MNLFDVGAPMGRFIDVGGPMGDLGPPKSVRRSHAGCGITQWEIPCDA